MKKFFSFLFALMAIMSSCTNDDIGTYNIGYITYNVNTQNVFDDFNATSTIRNRFLSGEYGDFHLGIYTYIYDKDGNLVDKKVSYTKTFGIETYEFALTNGSYTAVSIEMIVDKDDNYQSPRFELKGTEKLSTIEVAYRTYTGSDGASYYYSTSLWYQCIGVAVNSFNVSASLSTLTATPKPIGVIVNCSFYNFNNSTYNYLLLRTKNAPIGRYLDPSKTGDERFRYDILSSYNITSLIQLEYNAFEPACVPIGTFTLAKTKSRYMGSYIKLSEFKGHQNQAPKTLEAINNKRCGWFYSVNQNNFMSIPGIPIAYWVSEKTIKLLTDSEKVGDRAETKQGCATGDNNRFLRVWHEVSMIKIGFNFAKLNAALISGKKWFPINKGGDFRRWYGNQDYVIAFDKENYEALSNMGNHLPSRQYYFIEHIAWNMLTSSNVSFRYFPKGFVFNNAANACFTRNIDSMLGLFNSKFISYISKVMNPTLNLPNGVVNNFPYIPINDEGYRDLVKSNVSICKHDWDSHETSWDFETNPLVALCNQFRQDGCSATSYRLENFVKDFETQWEDNFNQLHQNEEELNRQFIEIYGLQDELAPDVPKDEITILQQGEISIENNELKWHRDVLMKQLLSYAVGCMMGRYSIDKSGLILANQGDGIEQFNELVPDSRFEVDDDGIVPLMSAQSDFADNATVRFKQWLTVAFGSEMLVENLNVIEKCLGKSIDDYFVKDFWKDHKKMYQNRPIYWLFSSKKGAFQCLAYMHRIDAYTAERIRTKYLLPHIEWLMQKQGELEANAANLNSVERKQLDNIVKQIAECREYHDRLHVIADQQIAFDLDDGVVVNYAKFGDVLAKIK